MRPACLAASWVTLATALVFIGLSFAVGVHIAVWTSILCAGLPTLGCFVWASALGVFPKRKADRLQSGTSQASPVDRSLSSRQRFVTLAFAVVIGLSCETAMVGLVHGKSVEENGNFSGVPSRGATIASLFPRPSSGSYRPTRCAYFARGSRSSSVFRSSQSRRRSNDGKRKSSI
jgi:hypothetical protein